MSLRITPSPAHHHMSSYYYAWLQLRLNLHGILCSKKLWVCAQLIRRCILFTCDNGDAMLCGYCLLSILAADDVYSLLCLSTYHGQVCRHRPGAMIMMMMMMMMTIMMTRRRLQLHHDTSDTEDDDSSTTRPPPGKSFGRIGDPRGCRPCRAAPDSRPSGCALGRP